MATHGDDFVLHASDVGEPAHFCRIHAGDTGRRAHQKGGRGARCDAAGLRTGDLSDDLARGHLQLSNIDAELGGSPHRIGNFDRHHSAAKARHRGVGIDDRPDPEVLIDIGHLSAPSIVTPVEISGHTKQRKP